MRAWQITRFAPDGLAMRDMPPSALGPHDLLVRPRAVALNYRDHMTLMGTYNPRQPLPLVPCSDAVGDVMALGTAVTRFTVGDRVLPTFTATWRDGPPTDEALRGTLGGPNDGVLRDALTVNEHAAVHAPPHLSDLEAACLPCAGVTAWRALRQSNVAAGSTVCTLGTGGVSLFALQLAKALGAHVCITSSSDDKLARAAALGADHGVNYLTTPAWDRPVREWSPSGVDAVIEVGGAGTLPTSLRAVRMGGTVALIGVLAGGTGPLPLARILMRAIRVQGIFVGHRQDLTDLCAFLTTHRHIRPPVDGVYAFNHAPQAFAHLAAGAFGKVVITHPTPPLETP